MVAHKLNNAKLKYSFLTLLFVIKGCTSLESLRFLALGDWGGLPTEPYYTPVETAVGEQMAVITDTFQTSFNLALGDNFYYSGVKDVEDERFFLSWHTPSLCFLFTECLKRRGPFLKLETFEHVFKSDVLHNPWYFIAGNHDHIGNVSAEIAYTEISKRWNFPNYYYKLSFKIPGGKSMDVVLLDTILLCGGIKSDLDLEPPAGPEDSAVAEDQWTWLEQQLASSEADYLLVGGHYPVYSIAEHGPTKCLVERLDPLLYKYNVTAYLSGHDHNLQHLQTNKGDQKMNYIVTGAANFVEKSRAHEDVVPQGSSKFYWAEIFQLGGFAYFEATPKNMTFKFINAYKDSLFETVLFPRK